MRYTIFFSFLILIAFAQPLFDDYPEEEDENDIMKLGGGTQQTCDGCRTVMEVLLQLWRQIDIESYKEAESKALEIGEYVPVYPSDPVCSVQLIDGIGGKKGLQGKGCQKVIRISQV